MKSVRSLFIVMALAAILPGAAHATHWTVTSAGADCDGWNASMAMAWLWSPDRDVCADVTAVVELVGPAGTFTRTTTETLCKSTMGDVKTYGMSWAGDYGLTLNGTYTAKITLTLFPDYGGTEDVDMLGPFTFTCGSTFDACHYTPGYWKNHPSNWPVSSLELGGRTYTQLELMRILNTPVRSDATIILAYHTIAAKLNVASGASPAAIASALTAADGIFATYGIGNGITGAARTSALATKDILAAYNEMECSGVSAATTADKIGEPGEEPATWGGLKGLYR